jgi:hypothetical protein
MRAFAMHGKSAMRGMEARRLNLIRNSGGPSGLASGTLMALGSFSAVRGSYNGLVPTPYLSNQFNSIY